MSVVFKRYPHRTIMTRFRHPEFVALENWRKAQPDIPSMSEAVRFLTDLGLKASLPEKSSTKDKSA